MNDGRGYVTDEMRGYAGGARTATEQHSRLGVASDTPPKKPEVEQALEQFDKAAHFLASTIETLEMRLQSVLLPEPPKNTNDTTSVGHGYGTELGRRISNMQGTVSDQTLRLMSILDRLSV